MSKNKLKIGLHGAGGRMGQTVQSVASQHSEIYEIAYKFGRNSQENELRELCASSDVIIDFCLPDATRKLIDCAENNPVAMVICTTGLTEDDFAKLRELARKMPILYASNTSMGAAVLAEKAAEISTILPEADVEVIDYHHRYKKDAPSGTAITIVKRIEEEGAVSKNINITSIRAGGIIGRHDVVFATDYETITITHQAITRDVFADGALRAAKWLKSKPTGRLYSMKDVLSRSLI